MQSVAEQARRVESGWSHNDCDKCDGVKDAIENRLKLYQIVLVEDDGEGNKDYYIQLYCPDCRQMIRIWLDLEDFTLEEVNNFRASWGGKPLTQAEYARMPQRGSVVKSS